ncbi:hypothetical protein NQ314_003638 [Rhamnusium bicolor]|uniref:SWIM-type domain-containing protein n=1 Tax=Rhamnusium bicolor TaxID=1586634 RepID=A0AAV8ZP94_9CUCU|nr:hypothetical protein NQ314_003638 [Rhamnusium bicolor]
MGASRAGYGEDAIGYVQVKREQNVCTVKGRIVPEHKVHNKPYTVSAIFDEANDSILSCQCESCAASQGKICKKKLYK